MRAVSRSSTRARHRMRCRLSQCRHRFTLKRAPEKYKRPVSCPSCGSDRVRSVEAERRREMAKKDTCRCDGIPFPHERTTLVGCRYHPNRAAGLEMTEEEMQQHAAVMETRRTAWSFGSDMPTREQLRAYLPEAPF